MSGTIEGGRRAAATNKLRHGSDFYAKIGTKGGQNGNTGGFATAIDCDCELIEGQHLKRQCAGYKGGVKSRRRKAD